MDENERNAERTDDIDRSVLVLLSGGVDSVVLAADAASRNILTGCVYVEYGQPAQYHEQRAAERYAIEFDVPLYYYTCAIETWQLATGTGMAGPRVVAGRNGILMALATQAAVLNGASEVWYGATAEDQRDYPDCRQDFIASMSDAMWGAYMVRVYAPFISLTREGVIDLANELSLDLSHAWSCYEPRNGEPCGTCNGCLPPTP